jgi:pimeloyl-ACP methyl ester carboxylesterase
MTDAMEGGCWRNTVVDFGAGDRDGPLALGDGVSPLACPATATRQSGERANATKAAREARLAHPLGFWDAVRTPAISHEEAVPPSPRAQVMWAVYRPAVDDVPGPRWLYLHGFASGPGSKKGTTLAAHYAASGIDLERLDVRLPSLEHLRLSAIIHHVRSRIGNQHDRAILFGSSLGGLAACRVAEADPRVFALVLLAPAFGLADGWRKRLGDAEWEAWRTRGWLETLDYTTGRQTRVDFGFVEEVARLDALDGGRPDVRVPTLIVHGVRDETVPIRRSRTFAKGKRHVRLVEVDDGHELTVSLDRIAGEADGFLAGVLGPGPRGGA